MSDLWTARLCLWAGVGFGAFCGAYGIMSGNSITAGIGGLSIVAGVVAYMEYLRS